MKTQEAILTMSDSARLEDVSLQQPAMKHQPDENRSGARRPEREGGRVGRKWRRPKANERPKAALEKVEGVGAARLEKYGLRSDPCSERSGRAEWNFSFFCWVIFLMSVN